MKILGILLILCWAIVIETSQNGALTLDEVNRQLFSFVHGIQNEALTAPGAYPGSPDSGCALAVSLP